MFSKACEYGIRATVYIADQSKQSNRAILKDIAKEIDSPEAFTAKILQQLVKSGIVHSVKGINGGFEISKDKISNLKLADVVLAIDGEGIYTNCAFGLKNCSEQFPCPVHHKFKPIKANIRKMLEGTSINDMSDKLKDGLAFLKLENY
ncbi:MAG TPA: Rrf2 family transcriptional regulator [Chitinophagales bacterium]|nr:Rrf2 family transcriptional regulator [Chitinophagales bacterium]HMY42566.1 Rrf2 family transcriptional regulator [Chitinophagales bacterium]HMZ69479.1 Rrf2 family transcriptional regulator [Chitinophagales bacterium]HMZ93727.1 Rrf2 family transcriptional regulator [Chitinophagales bacterium]HNB38605.1 Rrf2 family transcriptional regulator [Chitinophagales bacterium]